MLSLKKYSRERVRVELLTGFIEDALRNGELTSTTVDPQKLKTFLDERVLKPGQKFVTATDHRETLLKEARKLLKAKKQEIALLVFATWLEHFINSIIEGQCRKVGITHQEIVDILRNTPMRGKLSWVLFLLKLPRISLTKRKAIDDIMEVRNWFVHYKWKFEDIDNDAMEMKVETAVNKMDKIVKYLRQFERKNVIGFSPSRLRHLVRNSLTQS